MVVDGWQSKLGTVNQSRTIIHKSMVVLRRYIPGRWPCVAKVEWWSDEYLEDIKTKQKKTLTEHLRNELTNVNCNKFIVLLVPCRQAPLSVYRKRTFVLVLGRRLFLALAQANQSTYIVQYFHSKLSQLFFPLPLSLLLLQIDLLQSFMYKSNWWQLTHPFHNFFF